MQHGGAALQIWTSGTLSEIPILITDSIFDKKRRRRGRRRKNKEEEEEERKERRGILKKKGKKVKTETEKRPQRIWKAQKTRKLNNYKTKKSGGE